jgi:hypothetical protein
MAAGLGFKTFATGDVLTAGDTNGYLMQGVLVFASAAARDSAIISPEEGQFAYLKDTNVTTYYTGSAWANLDTTGMTNPMTTTGDTIYSSSGSTPARLGIGSTGQVLTVSGGLPTWATPTSPSTGLVLLNTTTFSGVSSASCSADVFSTTYIHYVIKLNLIGSASNNDIRARLRAAGTDYSGSTYRQQRLGVVSTTVSADREVNVTNWKLGDSNSGSYNFFEFYLSNVKQTTGASGYTLHAYDVMGNVEMANRSYGMNESSAYDAITIFPTSGTITGEFSIYGMSK